MIWTGHQLRQERLRIGLSLRALARLVGSSSSTLSGVELGHIRITDSLRDRLTSALADVEALKAAFPVALNLSDADSVERGLAALNSGLLEQYLKLPKSQSEEMPLVITP